MRRIRRASKPFYYYRILFFFENPVLKKIERMMICGARAQDTSFHATIWYHNGLIAEFNTTKGTKEELIS